MAIYEVQNLTYFYPENKEPALRGINLSITEGDFALLIGPSGCGKSTLLRTLNGLIPDYYGGKIGGKILFQGEDLWAHKKEKGLGQNIGMVFQDPEEQLILTNVEREIAFGLENLGLPNQEMKKRVAEVISFLDLDGIKSAATPLLSGGQKQKVVLASVLAMQPQVLLLDEPTSQLDPVSAENFLNIVKRLNEELGLTIVMVEQRLERCFHLANRIVALEKGHVVQDCSPGEFANWAVKEESDFIPPVTRLFASLGSPHVPLTVKEGRQVIRGLISGGCVPTKCKKASGEKLNPSQHGLEGTVQTKNLWFAYRPDRDILKGVDVSFVPRKVTAVLGQNGTGKSTLLKTLNGLLRPQRGSVWVKGLNTAKIEPEELALQVGYLSQNPNDYLFNDTVLEEIDFTLNNLGVPPNGKATKMLDLLHLGGLAHCNPRDLSGGERQRVALATVLAPEPAILLLDEPTRGMDNVLKRELGVLLQDLCAEGKTIILVTHDMEFVTEFADRVVLLFDGEVVAEGDKYSVLPRSIFYSGQINKLFRGYTDDVLTFGEALSLLGGGCHVRS